MKKIDLLQLSKIIMILTIGLFSYLALVSYLRLQSLISYSRLAEQTSLIKLRTEQCLSHLKDIETSSRAFLMTQDSSFKTAYHISLKQAYNDIGELTALSERNNESVIFINEMKHAFYTKINFSGLLINNSLPGAKKELLKLDQHYMDIAKRKAYTTQLNLDRKLRTRQSSQNSYMSLTPRIMIILSMSSLVILILGYLVISRELRMRISFQEALEKNIKALRQSNSELEQFANIASHDLQEPLRKIQTFSDRIAEKFAGTLNEEASLMFRRIQDAAARMQLLINDLLAYSSIGGTQPEAGEVDMNQSLHNVLETLSEEIEKCEIKVKAGPLPIITGYRVQVEQLFQNLLTNAIKFRCKERQAEISISAERVEKIKEKGDLPEWNQPYYLIRFKDNGIGFDEQYSEKLFVIFQRLHPKKEYAGTGIGLAICKKIADNHHGYIFGSGKVNDGAEFRVYFPAA